MSLYKIKKTLSEMLIDRGYLISDEEKTILTMKEQKFEKYVDSLYKGDIDSPWVKGLKNFGGDPKIKFPITRRTVLGNSYVRMTNKERCLVVFIDEDGGKQVSIATSKMIIAEMEDIANKGKTRYDELIIVTNTVLSNDSKESIKNLRYSTSWIFMDSELQFNKSRHILVPKHELLSEEEGNQYKKTYKAPPQILITDPIVKYYGWKIGDVIIIYRDISNMNLLSTEMVTKRVVVRDHRAK